MTSQNWPAALDHALLEWRATRDPELADLIDRITERCELPQPAGETPVEHHAWWVQRGLDLKQNPVTVGALLAMLTARADFLDAKIEVVRARWNERPKTQLNVHLGASNRWPTNFQERVAILLSWQDDPRVAMAIVDAARAVNAPHAHGIPAMWDVLAERVAQIGDTRVLPVLEQLATEPRGTHDVLRRLQVEFATRTIRAFENPSVKRELRPRSPDLAACIALLPAPPAPITAPSRQQIDALWNEVAAHPDDVGVRAVLGDALVEAGDLRGDVIVLQCNARVPNRPLRSSNRTVYDGRVKTLLRLKWDEWFGDLALVIARRQSEFRCGMLETATIGLASSPDWVFGKSKGHREVSCLHTVRPGWANAENFATFVMGLPQFPHTLGITGIDVIDALAARGATFNGLTTIELLRSAITGPNDQPITDWLTTPLRLALARLALTAPDVQHLIVRNHAIANQVAMLARDIRMMFPNLRRLAVDEPTANLVRRFVDDNTFIVAAV